MKVISYNIFQGGLDGDKKGERLEHIIDVIRSAETDVVGIQEACFWSYNDFEILKYVASKTGHSFFTMTPASLDVGETHPYSTAILSKHRILKETNHNYFRNAATEVLIDTPLGEIDIISLHLSPFTEEERLIEVEELLKSTAKYNNVIIMGDFNSLSVHDKYEGYVAEFNEKQMKKFVTNGMLRYDVINRFLEAGFQDIFLNQSNNHMGNIECKLLSEFIC